MMNPVDLSLLRRLRFAVMQGDQHVSRGEVRVAFVPAGGRVHPTAVFLLNREEMLSKLLPPVVFLSVGVLDQVFSRGVQGLGEYLIVVISARLAHAGVFLH